MNPEIPLSMQVAKSLFLSSHTRVEAFITENLHMFKAISPVEFPTVLLLSIFQFLDIADFSRLICTCKRFASFRNNQDLWKELCNKKWRLLKYSEVSFFPSPENCDWKFIARCFMVQVNLLSDKTKYSGLGFSKTSSDVYFGGWVNGQCEGRGFRVYFPQGTQPQSGAVAGAAQDKFDLYFGEWSKDYPNGHGVKRWLNGDSYDGQWRHGYTHGKGTYSWGIGDKYVGNYDDGKRNGEGTYYYADGSTYIGSWLNHKQHGFGRRVYQNGNSYEGEWREGNLEGKGTFIWQDQSDYHGDVYSGEWKDNTEHGQGEYRSVFGTVYSGIYNMGTRQGPGKFLHCDGFSWNGFWNNDIPSDLDLALHPKMRQVLEDGKCTQSLTGRTPFYGQVLFRCFDCHGSEDPEKRRYVCQNCIATCHKGHRVEKKIWTCGRSFCWCDPCHLQSPKSESNSTIEWKICHPISTSLNSPLPKQFFDS